MISCSRSHRAWHDRDGFFVTNKKSRRTQSSEQNRWSRFRHGDGSISISHDKRLARLQILLLRVAWCACVSRDPRHGIVRLWPCFCAHWSRSRQN